MDHAKCHPAPTSVPRLRRVLLGSLLSSIIQVKKTYLAKGSPIEYMSNSKSHELFTNPLDFCHAFLIHYESSCLLSLSRVVVGACGFPPLLFTFKCTTTTSCVPLVTIKHCCTFVLESIKGFMQVLEDDFLLIAANRNLSKVPSSPLLFGSLLVPFSFHLFHYWLLPPRLSTQSSSAYKCPPFLRTHTEAFLSPFLPVYQLDTCKRNRT